MKSISSQQKGLWQSDSLVSLGLFCCLLIYFVRVFFLLAGLGVAVAWVLWVCFGLLGGLFGFGSFVCLFSMFLTWEDFICLFSFSLPYFMVAKFLQQPF